MQKKIPWILGFIGMMLLLSSYVASHMWRYMHAPSVHTGAVVIDLERGASLRSLATDMQQQGLLQHPDYFRLWARVTGKAKRLQAGEYLFEPGESLATLIDKMVAGKVRQYSLTLIEGWTFREMMQALQAHQVINHTLDSHEPEAVMAALGHEGEHPEGRFYPDTYVLQRDTTDVAILQRAYNQMASHLDTLWQERDENLPLKSPYEALVLASIIEKESAVAEERPLIAGVFINRLRKNMRLQTDPTVIYGMGDAYKGDIRFRDLRKDTPYNTYTRGGLPPTPIAMPGLGALQAAVHPAETDFLYFVATGDGSGRHIFTRTLEEHEKAVDAHQRNRK
jgi:UPF0755 protein